jgi:hypothetical protein
MKWQETLESQTPILYSIFSLQGYLLMLIVLAIYVNENSGKFHQGGRKGLINPNFMCIWAMNVFAGVGFHSEG